MINILLAMKLFAHLWSSKKILIHCDNHAVVTVLKSGKIRDAFLAASARNIWYVTAIHDIEVQYAHISGISNQVADPNGRAQLLRLTFYTFKYHNQYGCLCPWICWIWILTCKMYFIVCVLCTFMCDILVRGHVSRPVICLYLGLQGLALCLY